MMDMDIAKDLSALACEARRKASYLQMRPSDSGLWNYEQQQGGPEALNEFAQKLETLIAKHFIHANLSNNKAMLNAISRQCREAIKREIRKKESKKEFEKLFV